VCICVLSGDSPNIDAVRRACKDVGSVSDIIFEMRFNPNVFSPGQKKLITINMHQNKLHKNSVPNPSEFLCSILSI